MSEERRILNEVMKNVKWVGDSRDQLRQFPQTRKKQQ